MNKQAHIIFLVLDVCCLWGLWLGYSEIHRIQSEIATQVDTIRFGNRLGFAVVGVGFPLLHILTLVGNFWKTFPKKYITSVNTGVYVLIAVLVIAGIAGSSWFKAQVENAGYVYCRNASGLSAISKELVYTKDMKICEKLVMEEKLGTRAKR